MTQNSIRMYIMYVPCYYTKKIPNALMNELLKYLNDVKKTGITYVIQHEKNAWQLKKFLEENKKQAIICGKILGCNTDNAEKYEKDVEKFIYIGSGKFHPYNLKAQLGKDVLILDPISQTINKISYEEIKFMERKRYARIAKASLAKVYGILVSLRTYQNNIEKAFQLKEKIESAGKKAFIFAGNDINDSNLLGFEVDAFINTACLRINEDEFSKAVINMSETEWI
ncbi:MAG: hypothetical protein GW779_04320 [Candidatus Altiarchaeum hamiconexum]|uniref:2-(3-amino-3-carboxypropyl)histidine synthase n=1 Tax=Candidatus Altarchaeum hamiconexum TaxID=1803513 RepID=A0A8J7YXD2_9ARCH|nr:hypothetical protein [Candidatus Altarchaeum hamiconexum]OIQ05645.1 MAG: hypothetical protein AUK59_03085 [Candidatus Altarchaeum sp. CG2_30_32_3053]PIN67122.1 MAG: hypothetical protein COV98_04590 [Candidatus Altarchaeum sp. CG12_big_fil_rev_8_21_14_0_65_33_22]PIV28104.1 MAG: hypothetical protein COS36_03335 [Candidatus Altarchaeum sp. CG03_land_8_20_14_0_80_32_618]PIZ30319.1 MAG: hypothetical protein COY41_04180 [Candidatus Altarchaeum sp. CG_4_10_14_0_8_um_filter_32_851]PJC14955.1 MAG: h